MKIKLGIYQHYKGNLYQVVGFARHSETLEELVPYQALQGNYEVWVRPAKMFLDKIAYEGQETIRFKYIKESFTKIHKIKS